MLGIDCTCGCITMQAICTAGSCTFTGDFTVRLYLSVGCYRYSHLSHCRSTMVPLVPGIYLYSACFTSTRPATPRLSSSPLASLEMPPPSSLPSRPHLPAPSLHTSHLPLSSPFPSHLHAHSLLPHPPHVPLSPFPPHLPHVEVPPPRACKNPSISIHSHTR